MMSSADIAKLLFYTYRAEQNASFDLAFHVREVGKRDLYLRDPETAIWEVSGRHPLPEPYWG